MRRSRNKSELRESVSVTLLPFRTDLINLPGAYITWTFSSSCLPHTFRAANSPAINVLILCLQRVHSRTRIKAEFQFYVTRNGWNCGTELEVASVTKLVDWASILEVWQPYLTVLPSELFKYYKFSPLPVL